MALSKTETDFRCNCRMFTLPVNGPVDSFETLEESRKKRKIFICLTGFNPSSPLGIQALFCQRLTRGFPVDFRD